MLDRPSDLLSRLRRIDVAECAGGANLALSSAWQDSGVAFVASDPQMEAQYWRAVRELFGCIKPTGGAAAILQEGGIYPGCWLESTGTISAELLSRFLPAVAAQTFSAFARHQRSDGLLPYKLTAAGPVFAQIQLVSPLARSVWTHCAVNGDRDLLADMYEPMMRYDAWLAAHRDTRGTGGVEAFCCYDTGHDLSPRFWHLPDSPWNNDPAAYDPNNPLLPLVAPDLTANVACQRTYLSRIAAELGGDVASWDRKAGASRGALFDCCYDDTDEYFYDLDAAHNFVRVQSDVLLRVLACEIGDDDFFERALRRYLLNTRKFFAKYPFTSIALDEPRFDRDYERNSWAGPTNVLSLIRAPHAFEYHGRHTELTWAIQPTLAALFRAERFAQTLDPFTGRAGFTEAYSPALLCLIDFVERLSGILPRPDGTLWFTGLVPAQIEHRDVAHETGYSRNVDGHRFELMNSRAESAAYRDENLLFALPAGVRVVTDRRGIPQSLIGMSAGAVEGTLRTAQSCFPFAIAPNEQLDLTGGRFVSVRNPGLVPPSS